MGSSKKVTVGYRYYMGLHFGLSHGPVDSVTEVIVGDRSAWTGNQTATGTISISADQLFGGDEREGGISGSLSILMGTSGQGQNSYLASKVSPNVPAFRGILSAVWQGGQVTANNPYVKPWAFRVHRILQGWSGGSAWYPEKASIGGTTGGYTVGTETNLADTFPTLYIGDPGYPYPGYPDPGSFYPGSLAIGPFAENAEIISGKIVPSLAAQPDDRFIFNGVEDAGSTFPSGTVLYSLPAGDTLTIQIKNIWDNGCGATGYIHIKKEIVEVLGPDMNPAHIIYQGLTDTSWGMGYPTNSIDDDSFTAAADALYNEGFGLSMLWSRQETIEQFIQIILDHIGGLLYVRPDTGQFALKLIRSDYDRGTLTLYDPDTLIAAENYQRQAWGETVNEMTVIYTDRASGKDTPVTAQDMANVQIQGGVVSQTRNYPGISVVELAQRVALRDLQTMSTPLARIKLTATRAAWQVFPGDVFRLSWPEYGIDDVVYRALTVNRGTLQDGQIIIDAVEDVFGLPDNTYLVEQPSEWEDPSNAPAPAPYRKLLEAPYWDLVRNLSAADLDYVDALSGYLETLAVRPSGDATNYSIWAKIGAADYAEEGNGDFCSSATIAETLTKTTTAITLENGIDLDIVVAPGYAVIDDEYVLVSAINAIAGTATISRGVLDTLPVAHAANARIWFADNYIGFSTSEFADGEVLDVKLLPITGQGSLDIADAPSDSITFDQRQYRPYPPAGLLFDGLAWPAYFPGGDIVLTWAHRDRTLQTAYIVEQGEASIGPEAGVTYSLEVADESLAVIHSETGITDDTATVPGTSLTSGLLRFRLWAVRGGLVSWQIHEHFAVVGGEEMITEDGEARITEDDEQRITE